LGGQKAKRSFYATEIGKEVLPVVLGQVRELKDEIE